MMNRGWTLPSRLWARPWAEWAAVFGMLLFIYRDTLRWFFQRWGTPDSYYSHGYLILPITVFLIWRQREYFSRFGENGRRTGLLVLGAGLLMHVAASWMGVNFVSGFSLIPVFLGLSLAAFGARTTRQFLFPICFLISMMPLPLVMIVRFSFLLKMLSTEWAIVLVKKLGIRAVQDGSFIHMGHSTLIVGDVCSGLRSLVALLTLGALFAYFFEVSRWRRGVLFLSAIPVALFVNTLRIAFLCFVAEAYGQEFAHGIVHDVSGILIFALSFILLGLTREVLTP